LKDIIKIIKSDLIYNGPIKLRVDTLSSKGKVFRKEVVEHCPSVGILPIVNKKEILLIKQYRHAVKKHLIEIPAGKIEVDESPLEAAKRELEEETGFAGTILPLTQCYLVPSYDTEIMHFFIAKDIHKIENSHLIMDDDENISNLIVNINDAIKYCLDGTIKDCKTISLILLHYNLLSKTGNN
jgi:ADP-ribose pyrophosphatase